VAHNTLVGLIPLTGGPLNYGGLLWPDCMMPLAPQFSAIQRAVLECGFAGCEQIWLICNYDIQPLIRHHLGDYILDPIYGPDALRPFARRVENHELRIPIYYLPMEVMDLQRRDCMGWGIIHGARASMRLIARMTHETPPVSFFATYPWGVYPPESVHSLRGALAGNVGLSFGGLNAKTGAFMGFSFTVADYKALKAEFLKDATLEYLAPKAGERFSKQKMPIDQRFSGTKFDLDKVFGTATIGSLKELPWYHDISTWEGYCGFLGSDERELLKGPTTKVMLGKEQHRIGDDGRP